MKKILSVLLCTVLLILCGCAADRKSGTMTITVFEAGKADAILIETEAGSVMIDTGLEENSEELLAQLAERNVSSLQALIISHFDKDHVGGADDVLDTLAVSRVYTSYITKSSDDIDEYEAALRESGLNAVVISGTQKFTLGGAVFEIFGASDSYEKDGSNNSSLIVRITYGAKTYLFMGDAQDERITEFLSYGITDTDFLKVPYHGHTQDTLHDLFDALKPEVSVITNGASEPSQKEIAETASLLKESGSSVYLTSLGTVTIECTPESFTVSQ